MKMVSIPEGMILVVEYYNSCEERVENTQQRISDLEDEISGLKYELEEQTLDKISSKNSVKSFLCKLSPEDKAVVMEEFDLQDF